MLFFNFFFILLRYNLFIYLIWKGKDELEDAEDLCVVFVYLIVFCVISSKENTIIIAYYRESHWESQFKGCYFLLSYVMLKWTNESGLELSIWGLENAHMSYARPAFGTAKVSLNWNHWKGRDNRLIIIIVNTY